MAAPERPLAISASVDAVAASFQAKRRSTRAPETLAQMRAPLEAGSDRKEAGSHHSGTGYQLFLLSEEAKVGAMPVTFEIPYQLLTFGGIVLAGIGGEV